MLMIARHRYHNTLVDVTEVAITIDADHPPEVNGIGDEAYDRDETGLMTYGDCSQVTCESADKDEVVEELERLGYRVGKIVPAVVAHCSDGCWIMTDLSPCDEDE